MNGLNKILIFLFLSMLVSCSDSDKKIIKPIGQITTFAFDNNRSGTINTNFEIGSMRTLKIQYPKWGQKAHKHMPLYLKTNGKHLLIFGNTLSELVARDLKSNKTMWSINLNGYLASTPVYSEEKNIIYALIRKHRKSFIAFEIMAFNLKGEKISSFPMNLETIYRKNNKNITSDNINHVAMKTALGINEINSKHYIYVGASPGRNPYVRSSKNTSYGQTRGAVGFLLGAYVDNNSGSFIDEEPLIFFTSKLKERPYTGFNTGIYLSGGASPLLDDNTILVATGNGPSFPDEDNYGCSVVRIDGKDFKPKKGETGYSYFSSDLAGNNECFASNNDFASSYPNTIKSKKNLYSGMIRDKFGNLYVFDPKSLSGNQLKNRVRLGPYNRLSPHASRQYSGGSLFYFKEKLNALFFNNSSKKNPEIQFGTEQTIELLKSKLYIKDKCLGILRKKGKFNQEVSQYYSGELLNSFLLRKTSQSKLDLLSSSDISLNLENKLRMTVQNQKMTYKNVGIVGYEPLLKMIPPNNYKRDYLSTFAMTNSAEYFTKLSNIFSPVKKIKNHMKNYDISFFSKLNMKEVKCDNYPKDDFVELWSYKKNFPKEKISFILYSFDITAISFPKKIWKMRGDINEVIDKNSLVTMINMKKNVFITIFNARNLKTNKSFVYLINSLNGERIKKYEINGFLHFSSIIPTDEGLIVPTINNGIVFLKK